MPQRSRRARPWRMLFASALAALCLFPAADGFYFSGLSKSVFGKGDRVDLWYNKIYSDRTRLPYAYVDLPYVCQPTEVEHSSLNLGELLRGDRIAKSNVDLRMMVDSECQVLCTVNLAQQPPVDLHQLRKHIQKHYRVEWIVDDLPGATAVSFADKEDRIYEPGFSMGYVQEQDQVMYVYNHFHLKIIVNQLESNDGGTEEDNKFAIVGVEVLPLSIDFTSDAASSVKDSPTNECPTELHGRPRLELAHEDVHSNQKPLVYTYGVKWVIDQERPWNTRWNMYMDLSDARVHWYSIVNSLMLLLFLTFLVAVIMLRTLRRDIASYNDNEDYLEGQDDTAGWKMVHGDIFRAPRRLEMLTPLLGSGVQIFAASLFTLGMAALGVLSPSYRGGFVHFAIFCYAFSGYFTISQGSYFAFKVCCRMFAGYYSAYVYKAFQGVHWKTNAFWTASVFPLVMFIMLCFMNSVSWYLRSSNALPMGTFFALFFLWFAISLPSVLIGAAVGHKNQSISHPIRTLKIPRQIPEQSFLYKPVSNIFFSGLIPFAVVYMELYFILKNIWEDQYYYLYGFLVLVFLLLIVTCVEITIVVIYFQLCNEDYRWHWKSFLVASASSWHIMAFSLGYYALRMDASVTLTSTLYFFAYTTIGVAVYALCTGMIGFFATYWFLRTIYSAVKLE